MVSADVKATRARLAKACIKMIKMNPHKEVPVLLRSSHPSIPDRTGQCTDGGRVADQQAHQRGLRGHEPRNGRGAHDRLSKDVRFSPPLFPRHSITLYSFSASLHHSMHDIPVDAAAKTHLCKPLFSAPEFQTPREAGRKKYRETESQRAREKASFIQVVKTVPFCPVADVSLLSPLSALLSPLSSLFSLLPPASSLLKSLQRRT